MRNQRTHTVDNICVNTAYSTELQGIVLEPTNLYVNASIFLTFLMDSVKFRQHFCSLKKNQNCHIEDYFYVISLICAL